MRLRLAALVLSVPLLAIACAAGRSDRPAVDREAIKEASGRHGAGERYASSRAYLHYLNAQLAESAGDVAAAIEELRLAVVYDDESPELRVALGWLYGRVNALEKAEAECRRALQLAPRDHAAHLLLANVFKAQRKTAEAVKALEKAVTLAPDDEEAYLELIRLLAEGGDPGRAEKVASRFARVHPNDAEPWRVLARAASDRGDGAAAERLLKVAVERDPWDFASALRLAGLLENRGRREDAAAVHESVLRRDPEHPDSLLGAARLALARGDDGGSRAYLDQYLGTAPDAAAARLRVALLYLGARRHDRALATLDAAGAKPEPRIAYTRGVVLEADRRFGEAARSYLQVPKASDDFFAVSRARAANCLSLDGKHLEATTLLLEGLADVAGHRASERGPEVFEVVPDVYRRAGRLAEGISLLDSADRGSSRPEVVLALARALENGGRGRDAVTRLQDAQRTYPGDERFSFALATVFERLGDVDASVAVMRQLLRTNPTNASALNFIGYVYADHGIRLDEARELLQKALQLRPDEGAYLDSLGWLHVKRGDARHAIGLLERADALSPGEPVILHHLAEAYARAGRKADAVEVWVRALKLLERDPDPLVRAQVDARLKDVRAGAAQR